VLDAVEVETELIGMALAAAELVARSSLNWAARKMHRPEEIVAKLHQVDVLFLQG